MPGPDEDDSRQRRGAPQNSQQRSVTAPTPLPKSIQENLDSEEKFWEVMYEGK